MTVLTAYATDIGNEKSTNQDSLSIQTAQTDRGTVVLAIVCDGMGGLQKGELASANVILSFRKWFEEELSAQLYQGDGPDEIRNIWEKIIQDQNRKIAEYGRQNSIQLGTTLSMLLIIGNEKYLIGQVGDSRVYCLGSTLTQITEDQTVVNLDIKKGILTEEEAENDPRRNVLLQCIGASKNLLPEYYSGTPKSSDVFLVCSDGFRHKITKKELWDTLCPSEITDEDDMRVKLERLIELDKERRERDNITAVAIKL